MTGLLHRLAARALGIASTVRPVAGTLAFPAQAEAPVPRVAGDLDQTGPTVAVEQALAPRPSVAVEQMLAPRPVVPVLEPDAAAEHAAPNVQRPPSSSDSAAAPTAQRGRRAHRAEPHGEGRLVGEVHDVSVLGPAPAIERAIEPAPLLAPRAVSRQDARRAERPEPAPTPDAPRLLPLRSRPEAPPVAALPVAPSRGVARAPVVEEATEVHVSIGRIEVTAVHEAPPPKRAPARPRKPRSLDEYLAGREERRS